MEAFFPDGRKRKMSELYKPQLLTHRFSSKSDILTYMREHRKYLTCPN